MIDYGTKRWPNCAQIVDVVRCSITVESSRDLLTCLNAFQTSIDVESAGCIKQIVRIKNMFKYLQFIDLNKDNLNPNYMSLSDDPNTIEIGASSSLRNNVDLSKFRYCDIKCNVLIETKRIAIIGEIQFILKFMLEAKVMGHSFYSFQRKQNFVYKVSGVQGVGKSWKKTNASENKEQEQEQKQEEHERKYSESSNYNQSDAKDVIESQLRSIISFQDIGRFSNALLISSSVNSYNYNYNYNSNNVGLKNSLNGIDIQSGSGGDNLAGYAPKLFTFRFSNGRSLLSILFENGWVKAMKLYYATVLYLENIRAKNITDAKKKKNRKSKSEIENLQKYGARSEDEKDEKNSDVSARTNVSSIDINGFNNMHDWVNDLSFWTVVLNYYGINSYNPDSINKKAMAMKNKDYHASKGVKDEKWKFVCKLANSVHFNGYGEQKAQDIRNQLVQLGQ